MARGVWQVTVSGVARVRHYLATKPQPPLSSTKSNLNADRNFRWIWHLKSQLGCDPWSLSVLVDLRLLSPWEALGWMENSSKRYSNPMLSLLSPFVSMTLGILNHQETKGIDAEPEKWQYLNPWQLAWPGKPFLSLESLTLPTPTEINQVSIAKILRKQLDWEATSSPKVYNPIYSKTPGN